MNAREDDPDRDYIVTAFGATIENGRANYRFG